MEYIVTFHISIYFAKWFFLLSMYAIRLLRFRKAIYSFYEEKCTENYIHRKMTKLLHTSNTARHFKITDCELNYEFNLVIYIIFNSVRISS